MSKRIACTTNTLRLLYRDAVYRLVGRSFGAIVCRLSMYVRLCVLWLYCRDEDGTNERTSQARWGLSWKCDRDNHSDAKTMKWQRQGVLFYFLAFLPLFRSLFVPCSPNTWYITSCVWLERKPKATNRVRPLDETDQLYIGTGTANKINICVFDSLFQCSNIFQHICFGFFRRFFSIFH